jgi:hypothetical protein
VGGIGRVATLTDDMRTKGVANWTQQTSWLVDNVNSACWLKKWTSMVTPPLQDDAIFLQALGKTSNVASSVHAGSTFGRAWCLAGGKHMMFVRYRDWR